MLKVAPLVALALLALPMPALAEDTPGTDHDRYVLEKAGDGFIRLDRETGALSRCLEKSGSWACESIADDRAADRADLKAEIDRLERQNEELKRRIAILEKHPGDSSSGPRIELPSQEDMDRFMALLESWMRRFVDFARSLGQDTRERQNI
jgi:hypothetical protein